jgi:1-phosphofructokinase family hexose kinase
MFLCISANPAIDKRMRLNKLVPGAIHRATFARGYPGGKAAHVAMVLKSLGERPRWAGFCGGRTGDELISGLNKLDVETHPTRTASETRTNLEIIEDSGAVTELLEPGDGPTEKEITTFEEKCGDLFAAGGAKLWIVFSGSLPRRVPDDFYARLVATAKKHGCLTAVDAGGEALRLALEQRPEFVKPNRDEAESAVGGKISSVEAAGDAARELVRKGARSAALSLGKDGMVYCESDAGPVWHAAAIPMDVQSTVGCGDSALAGFVHAFAAKLPADEALRLATACGAANCLASSPGMAELEEIERLRKLGKAARLGK